MSHPYYIITTDKLKIDDILAQIRAIKEFPCAIKVYDRSFVVATKDECWVLANGIEVGSFLTEELAEQIDRAGLTKSKLSLW